MAIMVELGENERILFRDVVGLDVEPFLATAAGCIREVKIGWNDMKQTNGTSRDEQRRFGEREREREKRTRHISRHDPAAGMDSAIAAVTAFTCVVSPSSSVCMHY